MKHASLYLMASEWVLTSMSQTTAGVWVANLVIHRLAAACDDAALGGALLESLSASVIGAPHPPNLSAYHREFREKLGVISFERFVDRSRHLAVHGIQDTILLTPHRNRGHRLGFEPLANKLTVAAADVQAVGQAVRECVERCQ
jgi:hypothetical protein